MARMLFAWARMKSDQLGPDRRGAGPRPWRRSTPRTAVAETHDTELSHLTHNAQVAPAWVLLSQPADELDRLFSERVGAQADLRRSSADERSGAAIRGSWPASPGSEDQRWRGRIAP